MRTVSMKAERTRCFVLLVPLLCFSRRKNAGDKIISISISISIR